MSKNKNKLPAGFKLAFGSICVLSVIILSLGYSVSQVESQAEESWETLGEVSKTHEVIVKAYRECRKAQINIEVYQCQLNALEYATKIGYADASTAFKDLATLSDELKLEHGKKPVIKYWGGLTRII